MVKIISNNVRGLNNDLKRKALLFYDLRCKSDIVCIQETHCTDKVEALWGNEWGGNTIWANYTSAARGVGILIKKDTDIKITNKIIDKEGRYIGISFKLENEQIALINIYAPNEDDPKFFVEIFKIFEKLPGRRIIVGDFNLALDINLDRTSNSKHNNDKAAQIVNDYLDETYMCDIWRSRNEEEKIFTYSKNKPRYTASRIDFFLIETAISAWIKKIKIFPKYKTDHCPVMIEVKLHEITRGKGYWKLNNKLLQEQKYLDLINDQLDTMSIDNISDNLQEIWEATKIKVIAHSQAYAKERAQDKRLIINQLEEKAEQLLRKVAESPNVTNQKILDRTQMDLAEFKDEQMQAVLFRTKATWYNDSEASTQYIYGLEKARSGAKNINCIKLENGKAVSNIKGILNEQYKFYKKLYTSDPNVKFDYVNTSGIQPSDELLRNMEGEITIDELTKAVKDMARNKSPGIDGLTTEFYIVFWSKIKCLLLKAINYAFTNSGSLHESALRGIISLIPKRNKDIRILTNACPISLLCTDYKALEKVLANRIKPVLNEIISEDQKGFLSSRQISENIRRVLDLIQYCEDEEIPGVIISIDFLKCFDRIETSALLAAMKYFSFGEDIIKWTRIIYTGAKSAIINAGYFSKYINITRSVRQGGPCSAYFFLLVAEILAIEIKKDKNICGIWIKDLLKALGQYADYIDLYLFGTQKSVAAAFAVINHFSKRTGFQINYDKTTLYRIGSLRNSSAKLYTKNNVNDKIQSINVLGVEVSVNTNTLGKLNYEKLIEQSEGILHKWKSRGLSLIGKVLVINTLIASLYVYKMTVLPKISELCVERLNKILQAFLWNGKSAKINLKTLQMSKDNGGLNLVNFSIKDDSLKVS